MKLREEQFGFALSSLALLLLLPAMLLAASSLKIAKTGGEAASIQILADKVNCAGRNITEIIKSMQKNKFPINSIILQTLAEKYASASGLIVNISSRCVYPLWIHVQDTGVDHYAGGKYCFVEGIAPNNWNYSFEDLDAEIGETVDFDYDEPILRIEKLSEKLRITVMAYHSPYRSDIYYSNGLLWWGAGGHEQKHVGETAEIEENLFGLFTVINLKISDPGNLAEYTENITITRAVK